MTRQERRALRSKLGRLPIMRGDNGSLMEVIRPDSPALALAIAKVALDKNDGDLFERLPDEVGHYTFIGYLALYDGKAYIVDGAGDIVDTVKPGDSFVTPRKDVS